MISNAKKAHLASVIEPALPLQHQLMMRNTAVLHIQMSVEFLSMISSCSSWNIALQPHFKSHSKGAGNEASKSSGESDPESPHPNPDGHPHIQLEDDDADPAPFNKVLQPSKLASLVDPKNMKLLHDMGGIEGVTRGLQTDSVRGLCLNGPPTPHGSGDEEKGAGEGVSQRHERQDEPKINIVIHEPNDDRGGGGSAGSPDGVDPPSKLSTISSSEGVQFTKHTLGDVKEEKSSSRSSSLEDEPNQVIEDLAPNGPVSLEDRKRVYGENFVAGRKTKSLLQLMWTALKDKVLVRDSLNLRHFLP